MADPLDFEHPEFATSRMHEASSGATAPRRKNDIPTPQRRACAFARRRTSSSPLSFSGHPEDPWVVGGANDRLETLIETDRQPPVGAEPERRASSSSRPFVPQAQESHRRKRCDMLLRCATDDRRSAGRAWRTIAAARRMLRQRHRSRYAPRPYRDRRSQRRIPNARSTKLLGRRASRRDARRPRRHADRRRLRNRLCRAPTLYRRLVGALCRSTT